MKSFVVEMRKVYYLSQLLALVATTEGRQGSPGVPGLPGVRGPPGYPGYNGQKGQKGENGGQNCQKGDTGEAGTAGQDGQPGQPGLDGQPGNPGQLLLVPNVEGNNGQPGNIFVDGGGGGGSSGYTSIDINFEGAAVLATQKYRETGIEPKCFPNLNEQSVLRYNNSITYVPIIYKLQGPYYVREWTGHERRTILNSALDGEIMECAVCEIKTPSTVILLGTTDCPSSWTSVYRGYMMTSQDRFGDDLCVYESAERSQHSIAMSSSLSSFTADTEAIRYMYIWMGQSDTVVNAVRCTVCSRNPPTPRPSMSYNRGQPGQPGHL